MRIHFNLSEAQRARAAEICRAVARADASAWQAAVTRQAEAAGFQDSISLPGGNGGTRQGQEFWAGNLVGLLPADVYPEQGARLYCRADGVLTYQGKRYSFWKDGFALVLLAILGSKDPESFVPVCYVASDKRLAWFERPPRDAGDHADQNQGRTARS